MWREKRHQEKLETLLKKSLYKYTTDHIWVIREKSPKKNILTIILRILNKIYN